MFTYTYPFVSGSSSVVTYKIEKAISILPSMINQTGGYIYISFNAELDPSQKTTLDTLMADPNIGEIPANTGNTNAIISDIVDLRRSLQTNLGIDVDIFPTNTGWIIQFKKVLTNSEKNKL